MNCKGHDSHSHLPVCNINHDIPLIKKVSISLDRSLLIGSAEEGSLYTLLLRKIVHEE